MVYIRAGVVFVVSRNCEKSKGGRINSLINVSYYCFRDSKLALCSNDNSKKMYKYIYIYIYIYIYKNI